MIGQRRYPAFVLFLTLIGFATGAMADTPTTQLRDTMERVLQLTQTFQSQQDFLAAKIRLQQIIFPRFDFAEMARRSLGTRWESLAGREAEFIAAFIQFAEGSYMNALGSYRGEKITYERERVETNFAEVDTQIFGRGEPAPITYKLHLVGTEWKVYDVIIDHISLVSNFHSQFGRILQTASIDELMKRLRDKAARG